MMIARPCINRPDNFSIDALAPSSVSGLHERESTRTTRIPIERDANAAYLYPLAGEGLTQLLLVDVIREITNEKTSTHPASFLRTPSVVGQLMSSAG